MITSNIVPSQRLLAQLCFVAVLGVVVLGGVEAANNSNDEDNNLGLMAKACASYCHSGVNGLDLWVSLEEVCTNTIAQPYSFGSILVGTSESSVSQGAWSPVTAGVVCGALWAVGIFAGFRSGSRVGSKYKGQYPVA